MHVFENEKETEKTGWFCKEENMRIFIVSSNDMRVFLTILFFAWSFLAKGQLSKEDFLNKIRPIIIDTAINHYYLFKQTETLYYNRQLGTNLKQQLLRLLPEDAAIDIITSISSDTVQTWWDENLLLNATLVNAKQADTLIGSIVFNYTGLNKKQQKKLRKDLMSKRERVYYFSRPFLISQENLLWFR